MQTASHVLIRKGLADQNFFMVVNDYLSWTQQDVAVISHCSLLCPLTPFKRKSKRHSHPTDTSSPFRMPHLLPHSLLAQQITAEEVSCRQHVHAPHFLAEKHFNSRLTSWSYSRNIWKFLSLLKTGWEESLCRKTSCTWTVFLNTARYSLAGNTGINQKYWLHFLLWLETIQNKME